MNVSTHTPFLKDRESACCSRKTLVAEEPEKMRLAQIDLNGFRSFSDLSVSIGDIAVLLGANGSGKSNVVLFFKMLNHMMTGALQNFVGKYGASQLLFYGPKTTEALSFTLRFSSGMEEDTYGVTLSYGLPDRLFVSDEKVSYRRKGQEQTQKYSLRNGGGETALPEDEAPASRAIASFLSNIRAYQFHDTSETSRIRSRARLDGPRRLLSDGGNLPAFLKMLHDVDAYRLYYERIIRHIRVVMPQFRDFSLEPLPDNAEYLRLNWRDTSGGDILFGPDQLSDGSLRFMALTALLLQPPEIMPRVIVIDEPELGLHPAAVTELAGMVRMASRNAQIILATQSPRLVDEFSPQQLVVVEWEKQRGSSVLKRLDSESLQAWMERYSLSDLWEKNVIGAQP